MTDEMSKHDHVLMSIVMQMQTMAMAHLGKITNPATGELERDLDAARGAIDVLEMLKAKCRTGTPEPLLQMLDQAVMDLQMNYLDEKKREAKGAVGEAAAGEAEAGEEAAATGATDDATEDRPS
jgi:hypothetical protein